MVDAHEFPTPASALVSDSCCPVASPALWGVHCDLQEKQSHFSLVEHQPPLFTWKIRGLLPKQVLLSLKCKILYAMTWRYSKAAFLERGCSLWDEEAQKSRTTFGLETVGGLKEALTETPLGGEGDRFWHLAAPTEHFYSMNGIVDTLEEGDLVMGHISWDCGESLCHSPPKKATQALI